METIKIGKYELNVKACVKMGKKNFEKAFKGKFDTEIAWEQLKEK